MGGSSAPKNTTSTQQIDPWLKDQMQNNINQWQSLADNHQYNASDYDQYRPVDETQQFQDNVNNLGNLAQNNPWSSGINSAQNTLQGNTGYQAQQVNPQQSQVSALNTQPFENEYNQQVIQNSNNELDRNRQQAVNRGQDQQVSQGAFNGSRGALVDSETNRNYADQQARNTARMNQQGYNTALSAAQQQQQMGTQNNQFNVSNNLTAQQANQRAGLQAAGLQNIAATGLANTSRMGNQIQSGNYHNALNAAGQDQSYQNQQQNFDYQNAQQEYQQPIQYQQYLTSAINGSNMGSSATQSQGSSGSNPFTSALGGAATGAYVGGPWGAAIGGGAGLLSGLF